MRKHLSLFLIIVASGCASVIQMPLGQNALQGVGKEVVVVKRPMPDFSAVKSVTAAALFGPLAMFTLGPSQIEAGNLLIKENKISDPAYEIAESLARSMRTKYGLKYKGIGEHLIIDDEVSSIANVYKGAPLAMDVKTTYWAFVGFSSGRGYRVVYHAYLRLIDTNDKKVIAAGTCSSLPEETDDVPSYDELVANGVNRLKLELKKASQYCAREFASTYLRM